MNESPIQVLLIEDVPKYARILRDMLAESRGASVEVTWTESLKDGIAELEKRSFDVILLEWSLSGANGTVALRQLREKAALTPVIFLSGQNDKALAAQTMHEGAEDYLVTEEINGILLHRAI